MLAHLEVRKGAPPRLKRLYQAQYDVDGRAGRSTADFPSYSPSFAMR